MQGCNAVSEAYVHGYQPRENERLHDQAGTLVDLLHRDSAYGQGSVRAALALGRTSMSAHSPSGDHIAIRAPSSLR